MNTKTVKTGKAATKTTKKAATTKQSEAKTFDRVFKHPMLKAAFENGDEHTKSALTSHLEWFETKDMPASWFHGKNVSAEKLKSKDIETADIGKIMDMAFFKETFVFYGNDLMLKFIPRGTKSVQSIDLNPKVGFSGGNKRAFVNDLKKFISENPGKDLTIVRYDPTGKELITLNVFNQ